MNLQVAKPLSCLAASLAIVSAMSQVDGPTSGQAVRVAGGVKSHPIDTKQFFPRIDAGYVTHLLEPENPMGNLQIGPISNLVAGKSSQTLKRGFAGAKFPAINATGWTPPDCTLAVGPNHVVATVNSSIAFFTKAGTNQFQQTFETFFAGIGVETTFLFDPKVFYDRINNRYVAICLEKSGATNSKMLLAVSDDNDPNGTWHRYRFDTALNINGNNYWLDYPGWGYNKDAYVISGNMFPFSSGGFGGVQFIVIPSAPILSGGTLTRSILRDANSGSVQIAEMIDATADKVYAINAWNSTRVGLYAIENLTGTPTWNRTLVTVPSFSPPNRDANSTNGRTLDTLDSRIFNASWRNGKLVCAHNTSNGNIAARWYEINTNSWPTSGTPALNQSGDILGAEDFHMPGISQNAAGDIGVMMTRSSSSITADLVFAARRSGDAAGTMGAPVLLESSAGNNYSQGRWGDYFKVDVDPVNDSTFWGIGMSVNGSNGWRTSIFSFSLAVPVTGWIRQNATGLPGITVNFLNPGGTVVATTTTDANGDWSVNLDGGTYTIQPIHNDKYFQPATRTVTVPPTATAQNFTAANIGPISMTFEYPVVYSDQSRKGTLNLNVITPVNRPVTMSDNSLKLTSPVLTTVPAGVRSTNFFVYGVSVTADTVVTVTGTAQGLTASQSITVRQKPALTGITMASTIKGGRGLAGTVTINKPAVGSMFLQITTSDPAVATVSPSDTAMPNGVSTKSFYCKTFPVVTTQNITVNASFYGSTATHNLQVTP